LTKYLVDPQVSILVLSSGSQRVIVEGDVNEAGVYQLQGPTTLLEMIAMAKGASSVADQRRVAVFRTINNQRMGAMFDVTAIQDGSAPDPELRSGDVIVVGHSASRGLMHDFLASAPALGLFVVLADRL
jgi:polysaccharide biosynthesis/export protein